MITREDRGSRTWCGSVASVKQKCEKSLYRAISTFGMGSEVEKNMANE
jgi:hypothetical protein